MQVDAAAVTSLAVAAVGGAAVGLERQWSGHADGARGHFAGLRTLTMIGALGGLSGILWQEGLGALAVAIAATVGGLIVVAYAAATRHEVDATTEVAAVVVLTAGVLAGLGATRLASAIFALTGLLLIEKSRLHAMVARLDDVGLRAAARFGVMAVVVLPLLPAGPLAPLGLQPRAVWMLVLFFSGISFAGFVARRAVGRRKGYWVTGLLGGLVSSTQITLTFARISREHSHDASALAVGAIAANTLLYPRVLLTASVLSPGVAWPLATYLAAPFITSCALLALAARTSRQGPDHDVPVSNPLQLGAALQMALLFQVVLLVVDAVAARGGAAGVLTTAALLGLTDVDALTASMARLSLDAVGVPTAAKAIAVGVLANTTLKAGMAAAIGAPRFRWPAGGALVIMAATLLAALVVLR